MNTRFTRAEESALITALNASLAAEVLDGWDDDPDEEARIRDHMTSALHKLWEREDKRKH